VYVTLFGGFCTEFRNTALCLDTCSHVGKKKNFRLKRIKVFVPVHVVTACRGGGGIPPLILNLGTSWR
jgi:hypothetical protein